LLDIDDFVDCDSTESEEDNNMRAEEPNEVHGGAHGDNSRDRNDAVTQRANGRGSALNVIS